MNTRIQLSLAAILLALPAIARDFTYNGLTYTVIDEDAKTCQTKDGHRIRPTCPGNDVTGDVVIPSTVSDGANEFTVTAIGEYAFYQCAELKSTTIPSTVTTIGEYAFANCTGLTSVEIPSSVTNIGASAFQKCSSLPTISIPESVTEIAGYVFQSCTALMSVDLPTSLTSISDHAFYECNSLESLKISPSLSNIGEYAFYHCYQLKSLILPPEIRLIEIDDEAFYSSGLDKAAYPDIIENPFHNITAIAYPTDDVVFENNVIYKTDKSCIYYVPANFAGEFVIPDTVEWINEHAFYGCTDMTSVIIPNSVTFIFDRAFEGCISLTSLTIPDSVHSTGNFISSNCRNLSSVIIPDTFTKITEGTFSGCSGLPTINLPSSLTQIGWYAFKKCSGLQSIEIPGSVTYIGYESFGECPSIAEIISRPVTPPYIEENTFAESLYESATLRVPDESLALYRDQQVGWSKFNKIKGIGSSAINAAAFDPLSGPTAVYNLGGVRIADSTANLAPGTYIIRQAATTRKIHLQ